MFETLRRRVGTRIILGYLASVSLMVIIAGFVVGGLAQIATTISDLANSQAVDVELSNAMVSHIAAARLYALRYMTRQNQADMDAYQASFAQLEIAMAQANEQITKPEQVKTLRQINADVEKYDTTFDQILGLLSQRQRIKAEVLDVQELVLENKLSALRVNFSANDPALFLSYSNAQNAFQAMRLNVLQYLASGDARYVVLFDKGHQQAQEAFANLETTLIDPVQLANNADAQAALTQYAQGFQDLQPGYAQQEELAQRLETLESGISQAASDIASQAKHDFEAKNISVQTFVTRTQPVLLAVTLGAIVIGLVLGWGISRGITMPLQQVAQTAQQIADVDLKAISSELVSLSEGKPSPGVKLAASPLSVKSKDEVGQMAQAFNEIIFSLRVAEQAFRNMTAYLNEMAGAARSVAQGNFGVRVAVRSPEDVLGNAIEAMMVNLRAAQVQVQRQFQRLAALRQIDSQITTSFDLEPTLNLLVEQVTRQLGVDAAEVLAFDPQTQRLECVARHGFLSSKAAAPLRLDESCAGQVILQNRLLSLNDLDEASPACQPKAGFHAYYGIPLRAKGQIIGVLQIFHYAPLRPDDDWLDYLETLAGQAAIAIDNAQLVRGLEDRVAARTAELEAQTQALRESEQRLARRAREMAALYDTALEINSQSDVPTLLKAVVRRAAELLGVRMGGLYLMRPDGQTLEMVVGHNMPDGHVGAMLRLGEGLSGRVAQTGKPMMVDDYHHWEGRMAKYDAIGVQRVLAAPLKVGNRVIGVININDDAKAGPFDEEEVRLVSLFADQAAIAVENARLHQAEREQRELAETLREIGATLASTLDVDTVLNRILEQVSRVVPNDAATIMLIEGDHTRVVRQSGYEHFAERQLATAFAMRIADTPTLRSMAESGEPLVIPNTQDDPRWTPLPETEWTRSYAGAPICARGAVIGFLNVDSATSDLYGPVQAERLRAFAAQAALAIENARLYTAAQQELAERKRIEAALRESEERYRAVVETSPDAITLTDSNGNFVMVNRRAVELFRFVNAEEMIGISCFDLVAPEDRPHLNESVQKTLEAGGSRDVEYTLLRKDGSRFPGEVSISVIADAAGKPASFVTMGRDISERKQAEELRQALYRISEAANSAQNLDALFRRVHEIVAELIPANNFYIALHDAATDMISFPYFVDECDAPPPPRQFLARSPDRGLTDYLIQKGKPLYLSREAYRQLVDSGEFKLRGELPMEWLGVPLRTADGKSIGVIVVQTYSEGIKYDAKNQQVLAFVSTQIAMAIERKRAEEELRRAKAWAEERSQAAESANRAKSIFLANMSHELRTPLNAILGFSDLMARDARLSAEQQENLSIINHSGEHLLSLINNVLDMAKIESGRTVLQPQVFDLYHLLDSLADMFRLRATDKGLTLIVDRAPDVPRYLRADEGKLRQVLINLLGNAVKFTDEGGIGLRVQVSEKPGTEKPGFCRLQFEVQDTGPGFPPQDLDAVFEPFVQSGSGQKSKEGSGLGLPISRQFVRLMGGDLTAESPGVPGQGAVFKFEIPVELSDAVGLPSLQKPKRRAIGLEPGQQAPSGIIPGGPFRLLVVEDRQESRKLLLKLLTQLGFEVRSAANGLEGLNVWREWQPHLVWMDMRMPIMDGHEATRRIKATSQGQATVIIALTATAFEDQRAKILLEGCDDFVRKPFRESDIVDVLVKRLGVRFVYEEPAPAPTLPLPGREPGESLNLTGLPAEWLAALQRATVEADAKQIEILVNQISTQNPQTAQELSRLANDFDYDAILNAIHTLSSTQ